MMRVPVHCCCEPERRLGWLTVPPDAIAARYCLVSRVVFDAQRGARREVVGLTLEPLQLFAFPITAYQCALGTWHYSLPIMRRFLAVRSDERPLAWWRTVSGFTDDGRVVDPFGRR